MPKIEASSPAPRTKSPQAPRPQAPIDGQTVDGRMAEFHWSSYPGAGTYRLQISRSEGFDTLHVDFTVDDTTVTELSGLLPIDGSTWHWRVRAEAGGSDWSDPATFVAGRSAEDATRPSDSASEEAAASAKKETGQPESSAEAEVPFHTARTSGAWAFTVGLVMVVTFVITLFFIASAV